MRKSLSRAASLGNSKAQEMLGLGGRKSQNGTLQVQRQGYLFKKPFSKKSGLRGNWQKRFFVLKDSFLFWYNVKPAVAFDMTPLGCLPLGGCSVFPMGKENGGFVFEVSHPDFNNHVLQLKSKDKAEVDDWIKVLQDCSKATWQNAMLGDALIQKLKHAGTTLEKEKEAALQEARRNAEQWSDLRNQKLQIMEEQLERQRQYEVALLAEKERAAEIEDEVESRNAALERERRQQEEERSRLEMMQKKLDEAYAAILKLEAALERRQRTDLEGMSSKPELQAHIATIKSFMNSRDGQGSVADTPPS